MQTHTQCIELQTRCIFVYGMIGRRTLHHLYKCDRVQSRLQNWHTRKDSLQLLKIAGKYRIRSVCVCEHLNSTHTREEERARARARGRDRKRDFPFSGQWILNLCFCLWIRSISSSYTEHSKPNSIKKRWRIFCFRNMNEWIFKLSIHCQRVFSCSDFRSSHIIKAFTERVHLHSGISLPSSNSVNFGWKYSDIQFA